MPFTLAGRPTASGSRTSPTPWVSRNLRYLKRSVTDIQQVFKDLEITFEMVDQAPFIHFISNPVMQVYVEVNCEHVWSIDLVPLDYDPEFQAMSPYISCRDHPFFTFKDYCNLLPKKPLET